MRGIFSCSLLLAATCVSGAAASEPPVNVPALSEATAGGYARLALSCVNRPYPFKPERVLTGADAVREPRIDHPVFHGCFDWHSAAHGHWMLVRLLRSFADPPWAGEVRSTLTRRFTREGFAGEAAFIADPAQRLFERPYGWAWALRLAAELRTWDDPDAARWAAHIAPLERLVVESLRDYLPKLSYPIRTGVHPNTAFALGEALDYARAVGDAALADLVTRRARAYYLADRVCPVAYEPGGEDFFPPCLLEADLMRRVLPAEEFARWLDGFLPGLRRGDLGPLLRPAEVTDPTDGKIVHLDGLNLVRAWTLRGVASALPERDRRRALLSRLADEHAAAGLARVASGHYEGEHWLASFAVYLQTGVGIEPGNVR